MLEESEMIGFVATSNPTKAREFYANTLGLTFVHGDDFALVFDANRTMLRIQIVRDVEPHGYTALGWKVSDIEKEVAALTKRGVKFERFDGLSQDQNAIWTSPAGAKIAWFKDPDKNMLSLTQFLAG